MIAGCQCSHPNTRTLVLGWLVWNRNAVQFETSEVNRDFQVTKYSEKCTLPPVWMMIAFQVLCKDLFARKLFLFIFLEYQRKGLTIVRIFGAEKLSIFLIGKFLSRLLNLSLVGLLLIIAPNNPGKLLYPPLRQCIFENSLF